MHLLDRSLCLPSCLVPVLVLTALCLHSLPVSICCPNSSCAPPPVCSLLPTTSSISFRLKLTRPSQIFDELDVDIQWIRQLPIATYTLFVGDTNAWLPVGQSQSFPASPRHLDYVAEAVMPRQSADVETSGQRATDMLSMLHRQSMLVLNGAEQFPGSSGYSFAARRKKPATNPTLVQTQCG